MDFHRFRGHGPFVLEEKHSSEIFERERGDELMEGLPTRSTPGWVGGLSMLLVTFFSTKICY